MADGAFVPEVSVCAPGEDHVYPEEAIHGTLPTTQAHGGYLRAVQNASARPCYATGEVAPSSRLLRAGAIVLPPGVGLDACTVRLWVSAGRVHSGLHYDHYANSLTVLRGVKRVILFPPHQSDLLYPVAGAGFADWEARREFIDDLLASR